MCGCVYTPGAEPTNMLVLEKVIATSGERNYQKCIDDILEDGPRQIQMLQPELCNLSLEIPSRLVNPTQVIQPLAMRRHVCILGILGIFGPQ